MNLLVKVKQSFKKISTKSMILISSIHITALLIALACIFFSSEYCIVKHEEDFMKYNIYKIISNFFVNIAEEKMVTEIMLNFPDKKNLEKLKKYDKKYKDSNEELKKYCNTNDNNILMLFYKKLKNISINIEKIRDKSITDLKRDKSILNIADWSIFFNDQIEKTNALLSGIVSNTYYSYIKQHIMNIVNILYKEFTLYTIILEKNTENIIDVFFSYSKEQLKYNLKSIENIIDANNYHELKSEVNNIKNKIDKFYKCIKDLKIIDENDFFELINEIKTLFKDTISLEIEELNKNYVYQNKVVIDKQILYFYEIFMMIVLLSLLLFLIIFKYNCNLQNTVSAPNITVTKKNTVLDLNREYIDNSKNLKNTILCDKESLFKNEVLFFVSKAKNNIVKVNEKLRVVISNVDKTTSFGENNINNNSEKEFMNCTNKIVSYDFKNLNLKCNTSIYKESLAIFDKFQELSYRSDIIKNIFIGIISELKLTYMELNIKNDSMCKVIAAKVDLLLKNIIEKSSEVKFYNTESKNVYKNTQEIISAIIEEHKYNFDKQKDLNNYIGSISMYIKQINKNFSSIYNHYSFIINSGDKLQKDIIFLQEHISEINKQISFIGSKIKETFTK